MRRITRDQLRIYAGDVIIALERTRRDVLVWWSIPDKEFVLVSSKGRAGRLLTDRLDDDHLACYVGIFEPSATHIEVREALEAHAGGYLR